MIGISGKDSIKTILPLATSKTQDTHLGFFVSTQPQFSFDLPESCPKKMDLRELPTNGSRYELHP